MKTSIAIYICVLSALSWASFRRPFPDADTIGYAAAIAAQAGRDQLQVSDEFMRPIEPGQPDRMAALREHPDRLGALSSFFSIRPLYTLSVQGLWRFMPLHDAFAAVSAVSFFAVGLLVLVATRAPLTSLPLIF